MATTRPDISIPAFTWTNVYALSGIPPGTAVDIWNKGSGACTCAVSVSAPSSPSTGVPLYTGANGSYMHLSSGEAGLWVYCSGSYGTSLLIQES